MATYKPIAIGRSVGNNSVYHLSQEFIYQSGLSGAVRPFNGWAVPLRVFKARKREGGEVP